MYGINFKDIRHYSYSYEQLGVMWKCHIKHWRASVVLFSTCGEHRNVQQETDLQP